MSVKNLIGSRLPLAIHLVSLIIISTCAPAIAQELEDQTAALEDSIAGFRAAGEYEKALEAAEELLHLWTDEPGTKPYELESLGHRVGTLKLAVSLPEDERIRLAQADSLSLEIEEAAAEGQYADAAELAAQRVELQRDILGNGHYELAESLDYLATMRQYSGDLTGAELPFRESLDIRRTLLGDRHVEVAASESNLADLLRLLGELDTAEPLLRDALGIFEEEFGKDDLFVATLTNNLGLLLCSQGQIEEAETLYREALAIRQEQLGSDHPDVANSLTNLAVLLHGRGDYAEEEPLLRKATAIYQAALGGNHPQVAVSLDNLGSLVNARGQYAEAEALHRQALATARSSLGDDHPYVALILHNLALALENQSKYGEAEPLFRRALEIGRDALGEEHPRTGAFLNSLAHLLQAQGDFDAAESLYREALEVRVQALGEGHLDVAQSRSNLASLLEARGEYESALELYEQALEARRARLGNSSAAVAHSLSSIGHLYYVMGNAGAAERFLGEAIEACDAALTRAGEGLQIATTSLRLRPPARALAAARLMLGKDDTAWPAAEHALARGLANLLIAVKQRPLDDWEIAREESLRNSIGSLGGQLATYSEAAAADSTGEVAAMLSETRRDLLAEEALWSSFRQELRTKYPISEGRAYSLERVQARLSDQTAIIGWVGVERGAGHRDVWAYAVRSEGPVVWASCEAAGTSPEDLRNLRGELGNPESSLVGTMRDAARAWRERVQPVAHALEGISDLVVIPSGQTLGVPLEAFVDDQGRLLGETYCVSYAPSATVFTWLRERGTTDRRPEEAPKLLLVGDPPFNQSHLEAMTEQPTSPGSQAADYVHAASGSDRATTAFSRLAASRAEIALISELAPGSVVLLGPEASEEALVGFASSGELADFDAVHIATHAIVDEERPECSSLVLCQVGLPDPLASAVAGTRTYDGLLTAKEIVREWELDADLITLSACETGLGRKVIGEGYIGFAHAFLQVGARSLLVGLWRVDDEATSLLMRRFYENWIGAHENERTGRAGTSKSKADALREAKLWLRSYEDERGNQPFRHPYYWAAFVLIGNRQ